MQVEAVFSQIESMQDREFLLRVSYMEVCLRDQTCTAAGRHVLLIVR
jgi:hypothetical protein